MMCMGFGRRMVDAACNTYDQMLVRDLFLILHIIASIKFISCVTNFLFFENS